jgi:hypothetical protein
LSTYRRATAPNESVDLIARPEILIRTYSGAFSSDPYWRSLACRCLTVWLVSLFLISLLFVLFISCFISFVFAVAVFARRRVIGWLSSLGYCWLVGFACLLSPGLLLVTVIIAHCSFAAAVGLVGLLFAVVVCSLLFSLPSLLAAGCLFVIVFVIVVIIGWLFVCCLSLLASFRLLLLLLLLLPVVCCLLLLLLVILLRVASSVVAIASLLVACCCCCYGYWLCHIVVAGYMPCCC